MKVSDSQVVQVKGARVKEELCACVCVRVCVRVCVCGYVYVRVCVHVILSHVCVYGR